MFFKMVCLIKYCNISNTPFLRFVPTSKPKFIQSAKKHRRFRPCFIHHIFILLITPKKGHSTPVHGLYRFIVGYQSVPITQCVSDGKTGRYPTFSCKSKSLNFARTCPGYSLHRFIIHIQYNTFIA